MNMGARHFGDKPTSADRLSSESSADSCPAMENQVAPALSHREKGYNWSGSLENSTLTDTFSDSTAVANSSVADRAVHEGGEKPILAPDGLPSTPGPHPPARHWGHSSISKIRSAFQGGNDGPQAADDQGQLLNFRQLNGKVAPFDPECGRFPLHEDGHGSFLSQSSAAIPWRETYANDAKESIGQDDVAGLSVRAAHCSTPSSDDDAAPFGQAIHFPVSKLRPFVPPMHYTRLPDHVPCYGPKIKPAVDSQSSGPSSTAHGAGSEGAHSFLGYERVHVPISKVRPAMDDAASATDAPRSYHHHLSKVRAYQEQQPLATPPSRRTALGPDGRFHTPSRLGHDESTGERYDAVTNSRSNSPGRGQDAGDEERPLGEHSISQCYEYPTYTGALPHSMASCRSRADSTPDSTPERLMATFETTGNVAPLDTATSSKASWRPGRARSVDDTTTESRGRGSGQSHGHSSPGGGEAKSNTPESRGAKTFSMPCTPLPRAQDFIHAPVPVSRIRPSFHSDTFSEHRGPSTPGSNVLLIEAESPVQSGRSETVQGEVKCHGSMCTPHGETSSWQSQSRSSASAYRRTAQWLREVLRQPGTYSSRLTERPGKRKHGRRLSDRKQHWSETLVSSALSSRSFADRSAPSTKSGSNIDKYGFKRAVCDLERLLNEALAIASQVVDQPPRTPPMPRHGEASPSVHSLYHSVDGETTSSQVNLAAPSTHQEYHELEDRDLHENTPRAPPSSAEQKPRQPLFADPTHARRPAFKHAATCSGLQRRPRLNDINQGCPGQVGEANCGHDRGPGGSKGMQAKGPRVSFQIPRRQSSRSSMTPYPTVDQGHASTSREGDQVRAEYAHCPRDTGQIRSRLNNHHETHHRRAGTRPAVEVPGYHSANEPAPGPGHGREEQLPERDIAGRPMRTDRGINLRRRSHVSLTDTAGFSLAKSHRRQATARDWSPIRKRFVAAVACISTALVGAILGIYSGLVPSIQYYIIDTSHAIVHGNTGCFLGLALPTFFLWPLPLLHGRKPYILSSLVLSMPLLFPQALAVNQQRLTDTLSWRAMLLASRATMGCTLGFASMNFHSILTDLFGASLMSVNPHQEVVDHYDARRHGGGMGVWLGIWTWCWIGSLGIGFLIGACIIDNYPPAWGFYVSIMILAVVLFLNVVSPEVRRSAFRRSVAEVRTGSDISRRVARGEVMMHRVKTGPVWWGQEVYHGIVLSLEMLRQPGFAVMALYAAWIYAQVVLIIILLGSLASRFYRLRSTEVGLLVGAVALGALLAIPFQKANLFSRSRQAQMNSNLATLNRKVAWSSHLVRRTIFTLLLPVAGICYAAVSSGPPIPVAVPTLFAASVGFLSCLAIAECNGLVMEAFDCSDLSPGMTGQRKRSSGKGGKRSNYSSFPRVTAGFSVIHTIAFVLAAGATALGGLVTRRLGQQVSTGVVAGILLLLTAMLLLILIRFTTVQIVPLCKSEEMDRLVEARRKSTIRRASMPNDPQAVMEEEMAWRPAMIGNPTSKKRRMNLLELGSLSRWQEIRRKNRLIDQGAHLNRDAVEQGLEALDDQMSDLQRDAKEFLHTGGARKRYRRHLRYTGEGSETADESVELDAFDVRDTEAGRPPAPGRFAERECDMSQTVGEDKEDSRYGPRRRH